MHSLIRDVVGWADEIAHFIHLPRAIRTPICNFHDSLYK